MKTSIEAFVYGKISVAEVPDHPTVKKLYDNFGNSFSVNIGDKLVFCPRNDKQKWMMAGLVSGFPSDCGDPNLIETDNNMSISVRNCGYIAKVPMK